MGNIFLISDTHFNHNNIIKYCERPFADAEDMNEELIRRWNDVVSPDDEVYHLGDFILGDSRSVNHILPRLNGHITLCRGNHDSSMKLNVYADYPHKIKVQDIAYLSYGGLWFVMCHFPMDNPEFLKMVIKDNSEVVVVHGHVHNKVPLRSNPESHVFNVSADVIDFTPVSINRLWCDVRNDFLEKGVWKGK